MAVLLICPQCDARNPAQRLTCRGCSFALIGPTVEKLEIADEIVERWASDQNSTGLTGSIPKDDTDPLANATQELRGDSEGSLPEAKRCPFCAEDIKYAAVKCRYCGEMLGATKGAAPRAPVTSVPIRTAVANSRPWTPPATPPSVAQAYGQSAAPVEFVIRPDSLWDDAMGWRRAAWVGAFLILLGISVISSSPAFGLLFLALGSAGIAGWWIGRSSTDGWIREGPAWIALGRVLLWVFRILVILTILGYLLSRAFERK